MNKKVSVIAPARLHMGFIDLSGSLGRDFGSIGVALNEIATRITIRYSSQFLIKGLSSKRAEKCARVLCDILNVPEQIEIDVEAVIPEHVGLGSGTQMALAIGSALNAFYGLGLSIREIAELTERGMRSGIGIGVFELGGLVVDGGRGELTKTPPVVSHMDIPENWRFILVFDETDKGLHGEQEIKAFKELAVFPAEEAARLCYLLLLQGLPAIAEQNIHLFGDVISQIQRSVGEHFASVQGGVFSSARVAEVMQWLGQNEGMGIGQTSWGPTGFCAVENKQQAEKLLSEIQHKFSHFKGLSFVIASASNGGGTVEIIA